MPSTDHRSDWSQRRSRDRLGLYVHVPFCAKRCPYCDFSSTEGRLDDAGRYVDAIGRELGRQLLQRDRSAASPVDGRFLVDDAAGPSGDFPVVDSVYFGGGTPSLLPVSELEALMGVVTARLCLADDLEWTMEINPDSLTGAKVSAMVAGGVNRVSIGAQSFHDEELRRLGRLHDSRAIREAVRLLREFGIRNLSLDLIYGWPGHELSTWRSCLDAALACEVEHLSLYGFHLPEHDGWTRHRPQDETPDEDFQADCYELARERLEGAGYRQYELSNFSRPGLEARHNRKYWRNEDVLGLGAGAWSHCDGWRWRNVGDVDRYCEGLEAGRSATEYLERLGRDARGREAMILGLRLCEGVDVATHLSAFEPALSSRIGDTLEDFRKEGLLMSDPNRAVLTPRGMLLANEVMAALV